MYRRSRRSPAPSVSICFWKTISFDAEHVLLLSQEVPKALLPVANRPVLSYVLELLELNNLKDVIVVSFLFVDFVFVFFVFDFR